MLFKSALISILVVAYAHSVAKAQDSVEARAINWGHSV